MARPVTGKTMTSNSLYSHLRRDTKLLVFKKYKVEDYSGFKIRVYPELVQGSGETCCIYTYNDNPLVERRGLQVARDWIDSYMSGLRKIPFKQRKKDNGKDNNSSNHAVPARRFPVKKSK